MLDAVAKHLQAQEEGKKLVSTFSDAAWAYNEPMSAIFYFYICSFESLEC